MNTDELKKLLKGSTAVLILDNGEPSFVILGYDSYKSLLSDQEKEIKINHSSGQKSINNGQPQYSSLGEVELPTTTSDKLQSNQANLTKPTRFHNRISEKETELLEKINKEILALKNEIEKEEKSTSIDG